VLSITYAAPEELTAGREFDVVLRGLVAEVASVRLAPTARDDELNTLLQRAAGFDVVMFNAYLPPRAGAGTVALPPAVASFVRSVARNDPTVLVSFGNPYLLGAVPEVRTYLLAWGDREVSQRAAARALAGVTGIEGRLPITLPGLHARGEGIILAPMRRSGPSLAPAPSAGPL
jgi:beta-N-acetylhexosaminidase